MGRRRGPRAAACRRPLRPDSQPRLGREICCTAPVRFQGNTAGLRGLTLEASRAAASAPQLRPPPPRSESAQDSAGPVRRDAGGGRGPVRRGLEQWAGGGRGHGAAAARSRGDVIHCDRAARLGGRRLIKKIGTGARAPRRRALSPSAGRPSGAARRRRS